mgnify:CR=1 FL=1
MKSLLALPPIFLGTSLTLYYRMLGNIDIAKGLFLFIGTLLFFYVCILFLVSHRAIKHYTDSFFLAIMLSGITIPVCFLIFSFLISKSVFLVVFSAAVFHIIMLFGGIRIVKRWYSYELPYFEQQS